MRNYFILFFTYFIITESMAQNVIPEPNSTNISNMTVIDSGNIRILYALNAIDVDDFETYDDIQRLDIGTHISKYYSFYIFNSDSLVTEWTRKNKNSGSAPRIMGPRGKKKGWTELVYSEIFKNFETNKVTEYARMALWIPGYKSSEKIPVQNWEIHSDTLTILSFLCQKATCEFRGREYTAWFTTEIPISNGPWKFGGLPGLIIKVYDSNQQFVYECIGVELFDKKFPIMIHDYSNYKDIARAKLLKLYKDTNENYYKVSGAVWTNKDGSPATVKIVPYNTIELE